MPPSDLASLDVGFVNSRLAIGTSDINGRLRKRYACPFAAPVPEVILGWLTNIVTPELYERRGWDPTSAQGVSILAAADRARAEMKEAADSVTGLYDLPLLDTGASTGVTSGAPLASADASPYAWVDAQAATLYGGGT